MKRDYDQSLSSLLLKAQRINDMSPENVEQHMKQMRSAHWDKLKGIISGLQPQLMDLFRRNPVLVELEETLDTVKEYFVEDAKREFKSEVDEIDILNKNGHFAYVCSRMAHYKELEDRMANATVRINKATARAKVLVSKLTNFKLNKGFLQKMLREEFSKRGLDVERPKVSPARPERVSLTGANNAAQVQRPNPLSKPISTFYL